MSIFIMVKVLVFAKNKKNAVRFDLLEGKKKQKKHDFLCSEERPLYYLFITLLCYIIKYVMLYIMAHPPSIFPI